MHREFFAHARDHLKSNGRSYIAQANFGPIKQMQQMARPGGFTVREIGRYKKPNTQLIFCAFELQPK
jgi:hypothetical protein